MKKFFTIFFVALGVIFLLLIIAGACFYVVDPYNLKPLLSGSSDISRSTVTKPAASNSSVSSTDTGNSTTSSTTVEGGSEIKLTPAQESALRLMGIDPANLPKEITPEQEACFVAKLGEARVAEIKAGASPTGVEMFQAKDCI